MAKRSSIVLFLQMVALACSIFLPSGSARAQDRAVPGHPIFSNPIQEAESLPWDIQLLRVHVFIDPESNEIRGEAEIDVIFESTGLDSSLIAVDGLAQIQTTAVSFQADSLFRTVTDSLGQIRDPGLTLPSEDSLESHAENRFNIRAEYTIESGLHTIPLGTANGEWTSVWTSFEPGSSSWIPFQIGLDDWFRAELRVSAPSDWRLLMTGDELWNIEDGEYRTVSALHADEIATPRFGFTAIKNESISSESDLIIASGTPDEGISLNEGLISMSRMASFYREKLGDTEVDSSLIVIFPGPRNISSSGAGLTLIPVTALPTGLVPTEEDFRLAKAMALRWIARKISLAGWTDVWIYEALSSYMAALYVRDRHGEDAYQHVLWNRREEYLAEARQYQRPLVWDRWTHPSELIDAHATGKGLWVFHMLGESHGAEFVWSALSILADTGQSDPITTEELRSALDESLELDLADYFDQWVYAAGHPILDYSYSISADQESVELSIEQSQEGYLIPSEFSFELGVESASLVGMDSDEFFIDTRNASISLPVALRPQYVLLDPLGRLLFENGVTLDPNTIVSSLRRNDDIVARYVGSRRLLTNDVDASMLIALRPILLAQVSPYVDQNLLGTISRMAPSSSALRALLVVAQDTTARARHVAVEKLGEFGGAEDARRMAFDVANSESDPLMLAAAVSSLVRLDSSLAWPVLRSALVTESKGEIVRRRAVSILPSAPVSEGEKLDALINLLDDGFPDNLRIEVIRSLQTWPSDDQILTQISSMWSHASGELRGALIEYLLLSPRSIDEMQPLESWLHSESDPVLQLRLMSVFPPVSE